MKRNEVEKIMFEKVFELAPDSIRLQTKDGHIVKLPSELTPAWRLTSSKTEPSETYTVETITSATATVEGIDSCLIPKDIVDLIIIPETPIIITIDGEQHTCDGIRLQNVIVDMSSNNPS